MKRVDLAVAVVAGVAVVLPLHKAFTLPEICESPRLTHGESVALMAAFTSYMIVPLLLGRLRGRRGARPLWLWTAVIGSMLTAIALHSLVVLKAWRPAQFALLWLALCLWTLPFAAVVYYSGTIVRGIKGRREVSEQELR